LPQVAEFSLRARAAEQVAALAPGALEKSIELGLADGDAVIVGDATMAGVLLRNLIDNAIRYTPAGGWINVGVSCQAEKAVLEVCDSGPGISPSERAQAMRRFYRVLGSGVEGSGLGLSIVQRIAELHGATVELGESGAGGLAVRVSFPRAVCL